MNLWIEMYLIESRLKVPISLLRAAPVILGWYSVHVGWGCCFLSHKDFCCSY